MSKLKRIISLGLMISLLCWVVAIGGHAAETDIPVSGVCGEGLTWAIRGGTLTISGSGAVEDYAPGESPWYEGRGEISAVVLDSGVTALGSHAFYGLRNLTEITFSGPPPKISADACKGVISWARYPDDGSWAEAELGKYGGILVWRSYCVHSFTDWISTDGYDQQVHTVCHRGGDFAPENTLVAYEQAKKMGFAYVEADVQLTKDNVPVLLHDDTIDRTSDGTGYVNQYTYEELLSFDFGSWLDPKFAGTKIPTFEQFLQTCVELGLKPYIELKTGFTEEDIAILAGLVRIYGMEMEATWISFDSGLLHYVMDYIPGARVGYLVGAVDDYTVSLGKELQARSENAFVSCYYLAVSEGTVALLRNAGLPLEVWTVNEPEWFLKMDPYITGTTSDRYMAGKILDDHAGVIPR